jgi:hypothetical protein
VPSLKIEKFLSERSPLAKRFLGRPPRVPTLSVRYARERDYIGGRVRDSRETRLCDW